MSVRPTIGRPKAWRFPAPEVAILDNGIQVLVEHLPGQQVVSAELILHVPLEAEDPRTEGVATICARVLDEGTTTHPGHLFNEVLESEGAAFMASQGFFGLRAMIDVPASRLAPALTLLADVVANPQLNDSDIQRHVALRLDEIEQLRANSAQLAAWQFRSAVYANTRIQRLAGGEPDTVAAITPDSVRNFHARHYGPRNATLILAGDFLENPIAVAAEALGGWANPNQLTGPASRSGPGEPTVRLIDRPGSVQADIRLGGFGIDRKDPRWTAFQVGAYAVGGAFLSRLNKVLREDRGYTYGVSLRPSPLRQGGSYAVGGSFRTDVVGPALVEARKLLDISRSPVTEEELQDAVNYFAGVSPLRYSTAEGIADQLATQIDNGLPTDYVNTYLKELRAVTAEEATAAYTEIVRRREQSLVVVGDAAALEEPLADAGFTVT